jgi:hypothetical protein
VGQAPQERPGRSSLIRNLAQTWESSAWPPVTFVPEDASPAMRKALAECMERTAVNTGAPFGWFYQG